MGGVQAGVAAVLAAAAAVAVVVVEEGVGEAAAAATGLALGPALLARTEVPPLTLPSGDPFPGRGLAPATDTSTTRLLLSPPLPLAKYC